MTEFDVGKRTMFCIGCDLLYLVLFHKHKIIAKLKSKFEFQISN